MEGMSRLPAVISSLLTCNEASETAVEKYKRQCAVALANLAQTHDMDEFLPQSLYACCQLSDDILNGPEGASDGRLCTERLLPVNVDRVLAGRNRLSLLTQQITEDMAQILGTSKFCKQNQDPGCVCWSNKPDVATWNPLRWVEVWVREVEKTSTCTPMCWMNARAFKNKKVVEIMRKLPECFGMVGFLHPISISWC